MRQKKCPCCGNRISSKFETAIPIPATTNEEVVSLKQPKNSTSFETLVKVPLFQSGIYGLFFGLPAGVLLSVAVDGNSFVIVSSTAFLVTGISWTKLSNFFNGLLIPFEETKTEIDSDEQPPIINLEITDKENRTMTTGNISAEIATTEDIIEFAKVVKRDLSIARWVSGNVHLTQAKFTQTPNKIFSQPRWTKFIKYLEGRKLVERKNQNAKNSPVVLTRTGVNFILQYSELEL